jgi:hypothetical protein
LATVSDAGTAASKNVPATGNAAVTEVVFGTDTRLSDTRTPTDNSVTSAKIVDGTIVNADISASAAITASKLSGVPAGNATMQRIGNAPYLDGSTGLVMQGLAGGFASTPDSAPLSLTGDVEILALVKLTAWSSNTTIAGNLNSGTSGYELSTRDLGTGAKRLALYFTGTTVTSNADHTLTDGSFAWLRVTRISSTGVCEFYTAPSSASVPSSWTQVGTAVTGATGAMVDATLPFKFGERAAGQTMTGTLGQVIVRSSVGGTAVLTADFSTQQADALSFPESSNSATVSVTTTRYSLGLPGVQIVDVTGSFTTAANTVYYSPFEVTAPIVVDYASVDVTTGPASTASVRMGIYAADTNQQPTGAPLMDSGAISVVATTAAVYSKQTTAVTLQPGIYLQALNTSVAMGVRSFGGPRNSFPMTMGTTVNVNTTATQTFGAFPTPGTAWTARGAVAAASRNPILFRWRAA